MIHSMRVMGRQGDAKIQWDVALKEEVESAEQSFAEKVKSGMLAFSVDPVTKSSEQIHEFDPNSDIVLVPQISGG